MMIKKILIFLSAAGFAAGLAGCDAGVDKSAETPDKAGEVMEQPKDAAGGEAPAPAPDAPAGGGQ